MSDIKKDIGQISNKKTDLILNTELNTFFKNEYHSYAVLKGEKLVSALYMVTNFIPENDPLRGRLRTQALNIVSLTSSIHCDTEACTSSVLELGALLSAAERAGLISSMNAKILSEEYAKLGIFLKDHASQLTTGALDTEAQMPANTSPQQNPKRYMSSKTENKTPIKRTNYKRHQNRREAILSLFDKKDKISIKDASLAIKDISEKTIQRELNFMVSEGVLFKEGERRWSTYRKV